MGDLSLTIARVARVLADVLVTDGANTQLGAIIEDTNSSRRNVHRRIVFVPQDLRRWGAIGLTVEDDRVTCHDRKTKQIIIRYYSKSIRTGATMLAMSNSPKFT